MSEAYGPISDYLPHRPPMLLIDRIDEIAENSATCFTTIKPDCIFAQDGLVHPSSMIEFVAQVCAIFVGVKASAQNEPPRLGFIIGCREVTFAIDNFAVGDQLTITASKILGEAQLAAFNGTVRRNGEVCMTIQMSVVDAELAGSGFNTGAEA